MTAYKPISVGLASYGMSGKVFHAPFLFVNPRFKLKKIVERNKNDSRTSYPEVEIVRSFEDLLDDATIELVVVNTPNPLHFSMAERAIKAHKHVILEKPFTTTKAEADQLIELAKENDVRLTVFQNRRWDSDFLTIQNVLSEKLLGNLVEYEAHYDRFVSCVVPNTWKEELGPGSGTLYNLGSHMIDQALVLFGKPKAISADIATHRPGSQIDDYYDLRLYYPGFKVILRASLLVREPGPRYVLHGTSGSFVKYGIDPQEEALKIGKLPNTPEWGKEPSSEWGKLNIEKKGLAIEGKVESQAGNYGLFYDNVYEAIREGGELKVKPEEAAMVIYLIELAFQSSKEGRKINL